MPWRHHSPSLAAKVQKILPLIGRQLAVKLACIAGLSKRCRGTEKCQKRSYGVGSFYQTGSKISQRLDRIF